MRPLNGQKPRSETLCIRARTRGQGCSSDESTTDEDRTLSNLAERIIETWLTDHDYLAPRNPKEPKRG